MSFAIGTVNFLVGQASTVSAEGAERGLQVGDQVFNDDIVRVAEGGEIEIILSNGEAVSLADGVNWIGADALSPETIALLQQLEPIAQVDELTGEVIAVSADGSERVLQPGDMIYADETIRASEGARVELVSLSGGQPVVIENGQSWLANAESFQSNSPLESNQVSVGTVAVAEGTVVAVDSEGNERVLQVGDEIYADEVVRTDPGASVQLTTLDDNGQPVVLQDGQSWLVTSDTYTPNTEFDQTTAVNSDIDALQQAILAGADPTQVGEATAAGGAPAAGGDAATSDGGGSDFVSLDRTGGEVDPSAGFDTGTFTSSVETPEEEQPVQDVTIVITAAFINAENDSVVEGNQAIVRFTLSEPSNSPITIATEYGSVVVPAGALTADLAIDTREDDIFIQGDEELSVTVSSVTGGSGEDFDISNANTTTTVVDDDDITTVSLSTSDVTEDDASVTFTATLSNAAEGAVTVTTSLGDITFADGANTGTLVVNTQDSDVYLDADSIIATITAATGGNFEQLNIGTASATAQIADTIDITTVSLSTVDVTEDDASVTFTATLSNAADGEVTVTTDLGDITIANGATTGTLVVNTQDSDVYLDADTITATITAATGGNFEQLNIGTASATAQIADTIDITTVSLSTVDVTEDDASVTFTATLSNAADGEVTVTTDLGDITIANGATTGTLVVNTQDSDVYLDADSITATISGATGGNFEQLDIGTASATAQIADTTDTVTATLSSILADGSNEDSGSITYTITLAGPDSLAVAPTAEAGETFSFNLNDGTSVSVNVAKDATTGSTTLSWDNAAGTSDFAGALPDSDVFSDTTTVTIEGSISATNNSGYESLVTTGISSHDVLDSTDSFIVKLSADPMTVVEGAGTTPVTGTIFSVVNGVETEVTNPYGQTITVDLDNGQAITIAADASSGSVDVAVDPDDYLVDQAAIGEISVAVTDVHVSSGVPEDLSFDSESVSVDVTDDQDSLYIDLSVTETEINENQAPVLTYTLTLKDGVSGEPVDAQADIDLDLTLPDGSVTRVTIESGNSSADQDYSVSADPDAVTDPTSLNASAQLVSSVASLLDLSELELTSSRNVAELGRDVEPADMSTNQSSWIHSDNTANSQLYALSSGTYFLIEDRAGTNTGEQVVSPIFSLAAGSSISFIATAEHVSVGDEVNWSLFKIGDGGEATEVASGGVPEFEENIPRDYNLTMRAGDVTEITGLEEGEYRLYFEVNDNTENNETNDIIQLKVNNIEVSPSNSPYEYLEIGVSAVSTSVVDVTDVTTATVTSSDITEDETSVTFDFATSNAPDTGVAASLTVDVNGTEYTVDLDAAGEGSLTLNNLDNFDVYNDSGSYVATISSINGGNFEETEAGQSTTATVIETEDGSTVTLTGEDVNEGAGTATITATVDNAPQGDLVLTLSTFTNGVADTITILSGQTSGSTEVQINNDDTADYWNDASTFNVSITGAAGGNYENLVTTDTATVTVADVDQATTLTLYDLSVSEADSGTAQITASLDNAPETELVVTLSNGATITFGTDYVAGTNVSSSQFVASDGLLLSVTNTAGGNYEDLDISDTATVDIDYIPFDEVDETAMVSFSNRVNSMGSGSLFDANLDGYGDVSFSLETSMRSGGLNVLTRELDGDVLQGYTQSAGGVETIIFELTPSLNTETKYDFEFELLAPLDSEQSVSANFSDNNISGGNISTVYIDSDGSFENDLDAVSIPYVKLTSTATKSNGTVETSTINTNNNGIGVGQGLTISTGETITLSFVEEDQEGASASAISIGYGANNSGIGSTTIDYTVSFVDSNGQDQGSETVNNYEFVDNNDGLGLLVLPSDFVGKENYLISEITISFESGDDFILTGITTATNSSAIPVDIEFSYTASDLDGDAVVFDAQTGDGHFSLRAEPVIYDDGSNVLVGSEYDDFIFGGSGSDTLTGGDGGDTFVWEAADADGSIDTVTDYDSLEGDVLDLSDLLVEGTGNTIQGLDNGGHLQLLVKDSSSNTIQTIEVTSVTTSGDTDAANQLATLLSNNNIDDGPV